MAIYKIPRGGLAPDEVTPYRGAFTQVETDEGITGLSYGGTAETKALGELLIGEDPIRVEYLWEKLYQAAYHRLGIANLAVLDPCLWDVVGKDQRCRAPLFLAGGCS
jgi:galactonate dehydratase